MRLDSATTGKFPGGSNQLPNPHEDLNQGATQRAARGSATCMGSWAMRRIGFESRRR